MKKQRITALVLLCVLVFSLCALTSHADSAVSGTGVIGDALNGGRAHFADAITENELNGVPGYYDASGDGLAQSRDGDTFNQNARGRINASATDDDGIDYTGIFLGIITAFAVVGMVIYLVVRTAEREARRHR